MCISLTLLHYALDVPPTPMPTTEVPPATNTTTTTTQNMSSTTTTQTATSSTTTESTTASSSTESTTATSSVDNSGSSSPEIQPSVTIAPNPLVNQSTATTIPPPVPPQTSGGNNTILIASVVGALSFVALCGAILFIIGTVLVARRKSINSRSALRASLKAGVGKNLLLCHYHHIHIPEMCGRWSVCGIVTFYPLHRQPGV